MDTISPSQLRAMNCRQKWKWQYRDGYSSKLPNKNLLFGSGVHAALEYYYSEDRPEDLDDYFDNWMELRLEAINVDNVEEIIDLHHLKELGIIMLQGYLEFAKEHDDFEIVATEKTLRRRLPIYGTDTQSANCELVARLDGLVREYKTGRLFSLEHKTFRAFAPLEIEIDPQFTAQIWVGQGLVEAYKLNEPLAGVIYNGLRKAKPGPRVKAKLFERHKIWRNQAEIDSFLRRAYFQYKESSTWEIYPQPNPMECRMCDFREPCIEKMRGGDHQFLLDHNFKKRRYKNAKKKARAKAKS